MLTISTLSRTQAIVAAAVAAVVVVALVASPAAATSADAAASEKDKEQLWTEPMYLTPEQMALLRAQQGQVHTLQGTLTHQAQYLQGQWGHLQSVDHSLANRDAQLLRQQQAIQMQLAAQQQQHLAVTQQQQLMMTMQNRLYHEQQAVAGVNNQLNMLTHPQVAGVMQVPGMHASVQGGAHAQPTVLHNGMPVGVADMHKLPGMAGAFDGKLRTGRFKLSGKTVNSANNEMTVVPSVVIVLHDDGTLTGTCEYLASRKYAATTVDVAGTWTESTLAWAEYYHGKTYSYRGTVQANKHLKGTYRWPVSGHGTFDFKIETWSLTASGMHVPVGFFAQLPDVKRVPYPEVPVKDQFTAGYYKVTGKTINDATRHVTIAPTIVMHFDAKNNALRGMAEYLASRSHDAASVRLIGKWGPNSINYSETYFGKTFTFSGKMEPSRPGFVRGKYTYQGTHGMLSGSFEYTFVRIQYSPMMSNPALYGHHAMHGQQNPALLAAHQQQLMALRTGNYPVAPAGNVYNAYAGVRLQ